MRNGLKIEHLGDIISKAQSWLVLNLAVFMFVYIHFNVPPGQNNRFGQKMYQMKRFIDMEHSLCLPVCFCFYQLGLWSVSYTANEYSIHHFCIILKDFFISLSRMIIVQDFETVTFYLLFVHKPTFSVIFC